MPKTLLFICFLFLSLCAKSQDRIHDSLRLFYMMDHEYIIEKFYREHIPLDGHTAQMIPFRVDEKYGFVAKGDPKNWLSKPQFEQVFAVYGNNAIVSDSNGYGVVNSSGKLIVPCFYENLFKEGPLFHGVVQVKLDLGLKQHSEADYYQYVLRNDYYTEDGKLLFTENAHQLQSFGGRDSLAWFRYGKNYTVRDMRGKMLTIPMDSTNLFLGITNNLLIRSVEKKDGSLFLEARNWNGELQFSIKTRYISDFVYQLSDNLYGMMGNEGGGSFVDKNGEHLPYDMPSGIISDLIRTADTSYFNQDVLVVENDQQKRALIDRTGKNLTGFIYLGITPFSEGKAFAVKENYETVLLNKKGELVGNLKRVLDTEFMQKVQVLTNSPQRFSEGLSLGQTYVIMETVVNGKTERHIDDDSTYFYYFDEAGSWVLNLPSGNSMAGYFNEGLAPLANDEGQLGFIDRSGKLVIPQKYELSMAGSYPLPYMVVPEFIGGYAYIKSFKWKIRSN